MLSPATSAVIPYISTIFYIGSISDYSIQIVYTTTNLTCKLQISNDQGKPQGQSFIDEGVTNWTDIAGSTVVDSSNGTIMYDVAEATYRWVRVVITGSGNISSARLNLRSGD